jgi:hypothetical protein
MTMSGNADVSVAAELAPIDGNAVIDLTEVRAARSRTASAPAAARVKGDDVFEGIERQAWIVGAAAELMISGMNRFIDELDVLMNDVRVAREFCNECQDACELDDLDAMIEARDRLRAQFDARKSCVSVAAAE